MPVVIKNLFQIGSPVNLQLSTSDSELSSDDANFSVRSGETAALFVQQSPLTDCMLVDDSTHSSRLESSPEISQGDVEHPSIFVPRNTRKRPRLSSSDQDSEPEETNRSSSPEIPYEGSPVSYRLHSSEGKFVVIKVPMSEQRTKSKKCNDLGFEELMNTDSDDETIFENLKTSGVRVVGSLRDKGDSVQSADRSGKKTATSVAGSLRDKGDSVQSADRSGKKTATSVAGSLRDKGDSVQSADRSGKKTASSVAGSLRGRGDSVQSADRSGKKTASSVAGSCRSGSKDVVAEVQEGDSSGEDEGEEVHVSFRIKLRRSTEQSNYKVQTIFESDPATRRSSRRSNAATPKRCALGDCNEEAHGSRKKTRAIPKTPTSSTPARGQRRQSSIWGTMNEEIEMPETIGSRVRAYGIDDWRRDDREMVERLAAGEILGLKKKPKTLRISEKNLEETAIPRSLRTRRDSRQVDYNENDFEAANDHLDKENQSENDLEEDSDGVTSRRQTRRRLSRSVIKTPRKEKRVSEEPSTSRRTPSRRVFSDFEEDSDCVTPRARTRQHSLRSAAKTPRRERQVLEEAATSQRTPRRSLLRDPDQETTNCRTPRTSAMRNIEEETPTTPRAGRRISSPNTPLLMMKINLTPAMIRRTANVRKPITALGEARAKLHVSAVPKSLPCREQEFNDIYQFLERKLLDNNSGCIYISGVPGTGKTATVNEAIRCLQKLVDKGDLENFDFVEINGMKLSEPRQAYVQILKQIDGRTTTWEGAYDILNTRFTRSSAKRPMMLLLVDELDLLCTKRQDVVYNLLDWPAKENARLVVITIANTMDLPERVLMGRVTSRLGLTRLTFQPYTHKQLQEIVMARLKDSDAFKSDAIELVARKVGAVSGDARRALDICRRATEIAELGGEKNVSMKDVNQALTEMIASFKVQAIRHRSEMEKMFLRAVSDEVTRTGVEETNFNKVYRQLRSLCAFEGLECPNVTQALGICGRLGASRLLLCEHSRSDTEQRILLNVSMDDLHFAMNINT